jgi:hypothetical protein
MEVGWEVHATLTEAEAPLTVSVPLTIEACHPVTGLISNL